jgi:aminoglycoside phosphotransferase (APT) family kinase protein
MFLAKKLEKYLQEISVHHSYTFVPQGATQTKIFNVKRLGGGVSNKTFSFTLSYTLKGKKQTKNFVLKMYPEDKDPVLQMDLDNEDPGKCLREYQVLKFLEHYDFPAPRAYVCEINRNYLGYPFVIMSKEIIKEKSINHIRLFAQTLAKLHNLQWNHLKIKCLKPPSDEYNFAKRQIIHFENLLKYLSNEYGVNLNKDFKKVLQWLRDNIKSNPCDQYSLIHGDYCPGNAFLSNNSRLIVTDWEWAEIGDPAYDVGVAYHYLKILNEEKGEVLTRFFINEYISELRKNIIERLEFYQVIAALKLAIFYKAVSKNPNLAYKYYGFKPVLIFPILGWFLRPWPQYLEKFLVEKTDKRFHRNNFALLKTLLN